MTAVPDGAPDPGHGPATRIVALNVTGTVFQPTRFIIANAAGTGDVIDATGHTLTAFAFTGDEQHVSIVSINNLTTTAHVWGMY